MSGILRKDCIAARQCRSIAGAHCADRVADVPIAATAALEQEATVPCLRQANTKRHAIVAADAARVFAKIAFDFAVRGHCGGLAITSRDNLKVLCAPRGSCNDEIRYRQFRESHGACLHARGRTERLDIVAGDRTFRIGIAAGHKRSERNTDNPCEM